LTLVDSNVLIDVISLASAWKSWSMVKLAEAVDHGPILINPIVFGELSSGYDSLDLLEEGVASLGLTKAELPFEAGYLAGRVLMAYRRAGGPRTTMLPDFLIGAHAAVAQVKLLTRDPRHYRTYFPTVELIAP